MSALITNMTPACMCIRLPQALAEGYIANASDEESEADEGKHEILHEATPSSLATAFAAFAGGGDGRNWPSFRLETALAIH